MHMNYRFVLIFLSGIMDRLIGVRMMDRLMVVVVCRLFMGLSINRTMHGRNFNMVFLMNNRFFNMRSNMFFNMIISWVISMIYRMRNVD